MSTNTPTLISLSDDPDSSPLPTLHPTRESWLDAFVALMRPRLRGLDYTLPDGIRISIGFPSKLGMSQSNPALGQCWDFEASKDGCYEIFISPRVSNPVDVMGVAVHELGHAAVGVKEKHGPVFKRYCRALGLIGKPTHTTPGPELAEFLEKQLPTLGAYPGVPFDPFVVTTEKNDSDTSKSRMHKVQCPAPDCGYIVRTTKKCLLRGVPTCPCGQVMAGPDFDADGDEK